ncbi:MAG: histidine--tRNA ligase, partial [Proteobacteria bacterium]|nr:histidine--tRNA ligase [Pseudomonadota bacterium]
MAKLQPVRGTHDLLPEDARQHQRVIDVFRALAERYGYGPISTPIFEFTEVFDRTLGETTDVVTKEMYTFIDRGGDSLSLRPELTAGIARAFISGGLAQHAPLKFYGYGPMFRHERPQKGRQRQFHQLDIEVLGVAEPQADIEVISLGMNLLDELGLRERVTLELNTLGDKDSRAAYRDILVEFLSDHASSLSDDSRDRLANNPLRILDSKDTNDRSVIENAPKMSDYLNALSSDFFAEVRSGLDLLNVPYVLNEKLVRGFDYYSHTAFEFTTEFLGSQGTVIGGGRYDHLIETMGGPSVPGIGWGGGIERL